jgi:hypothetical protein
MIKYFGNCIFILLLIALTACEEKISEEELSEYKLLMDQRLGHLGQAIIMQGRLLDAFNLHNDRADENHFKEAEELVKGHLEAFGRPDELERIKFKISRSGKLVEMHDSLILTSRLLIQSTNMLEDNAWLGGSVSYAENTLEMARVNFQNAVKLVYNLDDQNKIKPEMEHKEYDVGEKPESNPQIFDKEN